MSSSCTPILVGVVFPVSEILLLSKTAKFPFRGMDYSPWSWKNLIDWNRLKKFMQVGVDVTCMYTNFGGRGFSDFGDIATFKNGHFSLLDHGQKTKINKNKSKHKQIVFVYFCLCLLWTIVHTFLIIYSRFYCNIFSSCSCSS